MKNFVMTISIALFAGSLLFAQSSFIVPIVGRLSGAGGSQFRSDLKLLNPSTGSSITGQLVFTPRNQSPSPSDPSVPFSVPAGSVVFLEDVYASAFPGGSGAARVSIVLDNPTGTKPVVDTSTYTATSDGGELGQSPTVFTPADYFGSGARLLTAVGKSTERTNIFVMTGSDGATIRWRYRTANGSSAATFSRTYSPDATFQVAASELVGFIPAPNASLEAVVEAGSARVAMSPVNNITNQGRWADFKAP